MVLCVGIEQPSDHPLILRVVLQCLTLEEVDTAFAQGKRYLDSVIPEDEILRERKKIGNNLKVSEWLVCVLDFPAHRFAFLCANNLPRKYGSRRRDIRI
jgi:hypothetical protein